ncbi:MAG TPA: hypothetical protein PK264_22180 [Hyphomicrobiaceae bacterium]|nr:hypothetical protein [Hyphomicrobiaceae bacterium]
MLKPIIGLAVAAAVGAGGYYYYSKRQSPEASATAKIVAPGPATASKTDTKKSDSKGRVIKVNDPAARAPMARSKNEAPIELGDQPLRLVLDPPKGAAPQSLRSTATSLKAEQEVHLVIVNPRVTAATSVLYHVYLDLPGDGTQPSERHFVGSINFFGAVNSKSETGISFPITDLVKELGDKKLLLDATSVTLVPGETPDKAALAKAKPTVEKIEIIVED